MAVRVVSIGIRLHLRDGIRILLGRLAHAPEILRGRVGIGSEQKFVQVCIAIIAAPAIAAVSIRRIVCVSRTGTI